MTKNIAGKLGFWASALGAVIGGIYLIILIFHFSTEGFVNPTTPFLQLVAGIGTFLSVPFLVILFTAIRFINDGENKILGSLGVSFIILFAATVSVNRFVQLTVIQPSLPDVPTDLTRFLPYGADSVMFALEWLGWGFFSSLAAVFVAPLFSLNLIGKAIRWLFVLYATLSFVGLIGFMTKSPIASIAFIAWGPILLVVDILLSVYFHKYDRKVT